MLELLEKAIDVFSESFRNRAESLLYREKTKSSAYTHLARTIVRRAERNVVRLKTRASFDETITCIFESFIGSAVCNKQI